MTAPKHIEHDAETAGNIIAITGPIAADWSNALMRGHPVYIEGNQLHGFVPDRNAFGKIREDDDGHLIAVAASFPIPAGHPWHEATA